MSDTIHAFSMVPTWDDLKGPPKRGDGWADGLEVAFAPTSKTRCWRSYIGMYIGAPCNSF